jgi:antitoxin component YwqK of YwqJK toxin-antitoxin module
LWTRWYIGGGKREEGSYSRSERVGLWRVWYENGRRQFEGEFGTRVRVTWTYWYASGQRAATHEMVDSVRDGRWVEWYQDGIQRKEARYIRGNAAGEWKYWDRHGRLLRVETYRANGTSPVRIVDGSGKVIYPKEPKGDEPIIPPIPEP